MISALLQEPGAWLDAGVSHLPGNIGVVARRFWLRRRLAACGDAAVIGAGTLVIAPAHIRIGHHFSCWRHCTIAAPHLGNVVIGDHVSLNANVYINAGCDGRISIGSHVLIGPNVVLRSSDHQTAEASRLIRSQGHVPGTIVIEDDVWLAANVTVVGGVTIGRGAVVGANAVVTRDVAPFTIVGGVPAKPIGHRGGAPT